MTLPTQTNRDLDEQAAQPGAPRAAQSVRGARVRWLPLCVVGVLLGAPALAQEKAKSGEFSVQRFDPAPGPRNYFSVRGARTDGKMAWSAGLVANYQADPFVVQSCASVEDCDSSSDVPGRGGDVHVVEHMLTGDILGSFTPIERLQLGLKVPVAFVNGDGLTNDGLPNNADPIKGVGMGDLQLEVKGRAFGEVKDPFVAGGALFVTAPLGSATQGGSYLGDETPVIGLRGIFDGKQGPLSFGGNLAGLWRGTGRVGSTELGPEFRYGVAGGFEASPVVRVLAEGFGSTKFSAKNGTNSLEIDAGLHVTPLGSPIVVQGGGGVGVIEGIGVPTFRVLVGVMYVAEARDRDGDGLNDDQDQCPTEAEDLDGSEDTDGCPDRDNDGDTIPDDADKCPGEVEDSDGFQDLDGCPDPDNDADGVNDDRDQCVDKPETKNGFKDDDGCPDEPDQDGDGVPDAKDQCPDKPEDTDGFQDTDGCPDPDNDGDGIPDEEDECVDEAETKDGVADEDGCPEAAGAAAPGAKPGPGAKPAAPPAAKPAPAPAAAPAPKP